MSGAETVMSSATQAMPVSFSQAGLGDTLAMSIELDSDADTVCTPLKPNFTCASPHASPWESDELLLKLTENALFPPGETFSEDAKATAKPATIGEASSSREVSQPIDTSSHPDNDLINAIDSELLACIADVKTKPQPQLLEPAAREKAQSPEELQLIERRQLLDEAIARQVPVQRTQ